MDNSYTESNTGSSEIPSMLMESSTDDETPETGQNMQSHSGMKLQILSNSKFEVVGRICMLSLFLVTIEAR